MLPTSGRGPASPPKWQPSLANGSPAWITNVYLSTEDLPPPAPGAPQAGPPDTPADGDVGHGHNTSSRRQSPIPIGVYT